MQAQDWWLFYLFVAVGFAVLDAQMKSQGRTLRSVEAKLAAALRKLGADPATVDADLRRADETAASDQRRLFLRSVPLGLVLAGVGTALGALAGWQFVSAEQAPSGAAIGAFVGLILGSFLHGLREGMRQ